MGELLTYMRDRLSKLEPQAADFESKLAPIRAEIGELRRAIAAVEAGPARRRGRPRNSISIKDEALTALAGVPDGLTAEDIRARIKNQSGREIERTSLAPQLSRLCQAGKIVNLDGIYSIARTAP